MAENRNLHTCPNCQDRLNEVSWAIGRGIVELACPHCSTPVEQRSTDDLELLLGALYPDGAGIPWPNHG